MDLTQCNDTLVERNQLRQQPSLTGLIRGQLCAYDPAGEKDACQGDSGGPIQITNISNAVSTVIGVVSFGEGCATAVPAIYTRVAYYLDWIESYVWPDA